MVEWKVCVEHGGVRRGPYGITRRWFKRRWRVRSFEYVSSSRASVFTRRRKRYDSCVSSTRVQNLAREIRPGNLWRHVLQVGHDDSIFLPMLLWFIALLPWRLLEPLLLDF